MILFHSLHLPAQILHLSEYLVEVLDQHEVFDRLGHLPLVHPAHVQRAFFCRPGADVLVLQRCCTCRVNEGFCRFDLPPEEGAVEVLCAVDIVGRDLEVSDVWPEQLC